MIRVATLALAASLTACSTLSPAPVTPAPAPGAEKPAPPAAAPAEAEPAKPAGGEPFRNVYTQEKDSAPPAAEAATAETPPDAVPQEEPRGKYGNKSPYTVLGRSYRVLESARGYREEGVASWYGKKFHGHRTSSFERYDMYKMTAAHKTLPIPTYVRVTNLDNDISVVVKINDRGPFHSGRLIDLSWAAAQKLGYTGAGTARVRVESLDMTPADAAQNSAGTAPAAATSDAAAAATAKPPADVWYVQLGAYAFPDKARALGEQARAQAGDAVTVLPGEDLVFRVRVGPYAERATAERMRDLLRDAAIGSPALVLAPPP